MRVSKFRCGTQYTPYGGLWGLLLLRAIVSSFRINLHSRFRAEVLQRHPSQVLFAMDDFVAMSRAPLIALFAWLHTQELRYRPLFYHRGSSVYTTYQLPSKLRRLRGRVF